MKEVVDFSAGIQDRDVDERYIEKGKYRILRNGRILDAVGSHAGSITSVKGTREIFDETTLCSFGFTPIAVEAYEDKLYVFYARDTRGNVIMEYDTQTLEKHLIFVDYDANTTLLDYDIFLVLKELEDDTDNNHTITRFHRQTHITAESDVFMHVYRGLLYFHDRKGDPYKINIDKSRADLNYYVTDTEYVPDCITVIKAPPEYPLAEKTEATDVNQDTTRSNDQLGSFNSGLYSFAQRFEYEDGEVSAVSTFYPCPVIPNIDDEVYSSDFFNTYDCSYTTIEEELEDYEGEDDESTESKDGNDGDDDSGEMGLEGYGDEDAFPFYIGDTFSVHGCFMLRVDCYDSGDIDMHTKNNINQNWSMAVAWRAYLLNAIDNDQTALGSPITLDLAVDECQKNCVWMGTSASVTNVSFYEHHGRLENGDDTYLPYGVEYEDPVVSSFSVGAYTDSEGYQRRIFAFIIETAFASSGKSTTRYETPVLFIWDEGDASLLNNGEMGRWYMCRGRDTGRTDTYQWRSCHVTRTGDVFADACTSGHRYLHKFSKASSSDRNTFMEQVGDFECCSAQSEMRTPTTIASDASGVIIYAVANKNNSCTLYCSTSSGTSGSFEAIATQEVMFADVLDYTKNGVDNQSVTRRGIAMCCSADGLIVYVAKCGCVACTKDAGVTWNSYIVDETASYESAISIDCSADGRMVYAVFGATSAQYVASEHQPALAGLMYNSSNYARTWEVTECNPRLIRGETLDTPASHEDIMPSGATLFETPVRMRHLSCNDKGDTIVSSGFAWIDYNGKGYTGSWENGAWEMKDIMATSYPFECKMNYSAIGGDHYNRNGRTRLATTTAFISTNYGNSTKAITPTYFPNVYLIDNNTGQQTPCIFMQSMDTCATSQYSANGLSGVTAWGRYMSAHYGFRSYTRSSSGSYSYSGSLFSSLTDTRYPASVSRTSTSKARQLFTFDTLCFVPKDYVSNDIKTTKIKNNLVEALLRFNTGDKHVHRIQLLMEHGGTIFKIHDILRSDVTDEDVNTIEEYTFVNTGLYSALASKDANKLFDNVPRNCLSSTIEQDALFFGGYTDGRDLVSMHGAVVEINNVIYEHGDISLKCGQAYRYGIIFFDDYNRSTAVCEIGTAVARQIADSEGNESGGYNKRRVAKITIPTSVTPPEWATKFKFCRSKMTNNYYCINGFDGTKAYGNRICLDITTQTDIVPDIGDSIELVYEFETENETKRLTLPIVGYIDNKSGVYWGVGEGTDAILGQGRWAVVSDNEEQRYNLTAVQGGTEYFTSSYFYLNKPQDIVGDISYYEIPYTFAIDRDNRAWATDHSPFGEEIYIGEHEKRNTGKTSPHAPVRAIEKDDTGATTGVSYTLYDDGDVIIMAHPARELSLLEDNSRWTTLGRPNLAIENYKEEERKAGVCVSERYVYDTHYNGLSSFNTALINYKDLDHRYGSIEAIGFLHDALCIYQKYRLSMLQYRKQTLSTARDEGIVTSTQDIFGEQSFFAEEYGLTDHHSLAVWGNTRYFADQQRGKVLRVSTNGIYPISEYGMRQHFFNTLAGYTGKMLASFSPEHMSYMIIHEDEEGNIKADNFYETQNGWSGEFEMNPDLIANTHNGVYSIKDGRVYKNDVEAEPIIFGEEVETVIRIPFHEYIDSIKTYNAIQIEGNKAPSKAVFESDSGESTIGAYNFEHREAQWTAPLPMAGDVKGSQPRYLGYLEQNDYATRSDDGYYYHTYTLPFKVFGLHLGDRVQLCEKGDDGKLHPHSHYAEEEYIIVGREGLTLTLRSDASRLPYHTYLVAFDLSQVNGATHKGKSLMAELHFKGETLVKSLMIDIDESKI